MNNIDTIKLAHNYFLTLYFDRFKLDYKYECKLFNSLKTEHKIDFINKLNEVCSNNLEIYFNNITDKSAIYQDMENEIKAIITFDKLIKSYKVVDNFLVDTNNNKADLSKNTKEICINMLVSLVNCFNCTNCIDCENCKDCIDCFKCKNCENCNGVYNKQNSKNLT